MTNIDYLYNKDAVKNVFDKNYFIDRALHFKMIESGTILPDKVMYVNGQWTWGFGGIVDNRNEFIPSSFVAEGSGGAYTPREEIARSPATVIYMGLFYPVWGHAITDNIRRMWFLKSEIFKTYFKNCPIVYIPWGGMFPIERQKNFKRFLEILEIDISRFQPIYHPVQFENIILPDGSFGDGFTKEYREAIEQLRTFAQKNRKKISAKKIYYFYGRAQFGEERLAQYFKSKGYEIVSPERLTLDEQLNLMINCKSFASTLGSCAHNCVFLRDNTEVAIIPRAGSRFQITEYQQKLEQVHPLKVNYIDSSLSVFETFNGPYCFIISEQLKKFFGDKFKGYEDDDFKNFLAYVKFSMGRGFKVNNQAMQYYAPAYQKFIAQLKKREDLTKAYGVNLN